MKAFGIACIAIGAAWGVRVAALERRRRRRLLSDLRAALARLSDEIRIARAPLPELLRGLSTSCAPDAAAFFRAVADSAAPSALSDSAAPSAVRFAPDALPLSDSAAPSDALPFAPSDAPPLSAVWLAASDALPLSAADAQTLRELAPVLRGDERQLRDALALAAARLERSLQELDKSAAADAQRSAALICSAAALLAILLY